jgi:hypothetical protein
MRPIWLTYILIFLASLSYSQGGFVKKIYPAGFSSSGVQHIVESPDGKLICIGVGVDSISGISKLILLTTDSKGNFLHLKSYGRSGLYFFDNESPGPILQDNSGFYYGASVGDSNNRTLGMLIKFNFLCDTVWNRIYQIPPPKDIFLEGMSRSHDGGFLLCGFSQNWGSDGGGVLCRVIKTDSLGNEKWRTRFKEPQQNICDAIDVVQDKSSGRIIAVGQQYIGSNANGPMGQSSILILDSGGNVQKHFSFNNANGQGFISVIQLKDGNFLTCGSMNANNDLSSNTRFRSLIVKFDLDGNQIWSSQYDTLSMFNCVAFLHECNNGDIIAAGQLDTVLNYGLAPMIKIQLCKLDKNGNVKAKRFVGSANDMHSSEFPRSFHLASDGGFFLAGWNVLMHLPRPFNIIKVDSNFCDTLAEFCPAVSYVGVKEIRNGSANLSVYPVPVGDMVNVTGLVGTEFAISLMDVWGRTVKRLLLKNGTEHTAVDVSRLQPGIYFMSVIAPGKAEIRYKIIKE